jgi:dethiobiotin synthetase
VSRIIVVTGTDTGAGKTVFTALLTHFLRHQGNHVAALKPICSGGRADARALHRASAGALPLDEINPWHFRAPVAPLLAARNEKVQVHLREVASHIHTIALRFSIVLVEGAGGLLSPLGENFSTRELIAALTADVIVVARNQLGVVNRTRLTLEALPPLTRARAKVVLISPQRSTAASRTNIALLSEFIGEGHIVALPWIDVRQLRAVVTSPRVQRALKGLI